ncbi:hypothetical protein R1flu_008681 [Riccia fluitans]|uniref:Uncharacterized protein n=1 Tax=Riccia fluitans TaxID=41844 RepID=A0ABD1YCP7_9MARC
MALLWFCKYEEALGILEKDYPNGKEAIVYIRAIEPRKFSRYALVLPSQAIPPITKQDLASHITCWAPEVAIRRGRARIVRIPNGGGTSRRHREYMYPKRDKPRLISFHGPLTTISKETAGHSTQHGRGKSMRRIVLSRQLSKLLENVSAPSVPLQVLESQQKTCEDLTDRLVEAGATVAALQAELKQKDEEIAALKERLQASEQKMQREEARNAWLNEVTDTLRSEIQTLRSEGTKAKLIGKLPDRDWVHEAKQRWKANPSPENMRHLSEALEEHEDQIMAREMMFLKHTMYLIITDGDEEAPPNLWRAAMILWHRNDVLYTSAEWQQQLEAPFTSFSGWNYVVLFEGGTINVLEQFRGKHIALFVSS